MHTRPETPPRQIADLEVGGATDDEEPEPAAVVHTVVAVTGNSSCVEAMGVAQCHRRRCSSNPADRRHRDPGPRSAGRVVTKDAPLVQVSLTHDSETQIAAAQMALENASKSWISRSSGWTRVLATRTDLVVAQSARDKPTASGSAACRAPHQDGVLHAHSPESSEPSAFRPEAPCLLERP